MTTKNRQEPPTGPSKAAMGSEFLSRVAESPVIAVLRGTSSTHVVPLARALYEEGIRFIEVTLTTPQAFDAIAAAVRDLPADALIGAGTVLTSGEAASAVAAGAHYLLAPNADETVISAALEMAIPVVPGAATPTEVVRAWEFGASAVKVFPAASLGGPAFISALSDPLPHIPLIPTGGVAIDQAGEYLYAGAVAVGIGGSMIGDALISGNLRAARARAGQVVAACIPGAI